MSVYVYTTYKVIYCFNLQAREQVVICLGIIDYLVEFNWYKYMEYTMKIAMYGMREAKGVSV